MMPHKSNSLSKSHPLKFHCIRTFVNPRMFRLKYSKGEGNSHDALHEKHLCVGCFYRGSDSDVIDSDCFLCARHCAKYFTIIFLFICISASG